MAGDAASVLPHIQKLYENVGSQPDMGFDALLSSTNVHDDAELAELIDADGRVRIAAGRPVDLDRYLSVVPELARRDVPLDAAIDVSLRSLAGGSRISRAAIEQLVQRYPDLEAEIREAAVLNATIWSTTGLRARVAEPPTKPLPCEFGPPTTSGQRRYLLQKLLGRGAFGQVYLALDRSLSEEGHGALVAIKVLVAGGDRSPWARQRIIDEATKARRINHANVVQVIDRGVSEHDEDFIVYEFADGGDLSDRVAAGPPMSVSEAVRLVAQIARGVHAAHSAGLIHCDLKPGNIMLTAAGVPKVADFGIAVRLSDRRAHHVENSDEHGPIGNLAFISPEQYRSEEDAFSVLSDVYALGGILYLLLTGVLPNGSTLEEIAATHNPRSGRSEAPLLRHHRPAVNGDLEAICRRAMAVSPADRYNSAVALAEDLERWLDLRPIPWTHPGIFHVIGLWACRKPPLAIALAVIVVLAAAGLAVGLHFRSVANEQALNAAIHKVKLEEEEKNKARIHGIGVRVYSGLNVLKSDSFRLNLEALPQLWVFEYLFGPQVLGMPDVQAALWQNRIKIIRNIVKLAHEQGRPNDVKTLWWETALAFWLVCDKDYLEAEPLLAGNLEKWRQKLEPTDDMLVEVEAIRTCAKVNRYGLLARTQNVSSEELDQLRDELERAEAALPKYDVGTPIHFMILRSMIDLHGPALLDEPETVQNLHVQLRTLLDSTAAKKSQPADAQNKSAGLNEAGASTHR